MTCKICNGNVGQLTSGVCGKCAENAKMIMLEKTSKDLISLTEENDKLGIEIDEMDALATNTEMRNCYLRQENATLREVVEKLYGSFCMCADPCECESCIETENMFTEILQKEAENGQ